MSDKTPTIKGIFVKSHIKGLEKEKGEEGVRLLGEKFGKPLDFKNSDSIPIRDEVRLLECAVEILNQDLPKEKIAYEAGRLHFKNFLTTPLAKILFPFFKGQFKLMMMQAQSIAGHVFEGVEFTSSELGEKNVKVSIKNNDYPLEHFQGLLQEWMNYSDLKGTVEAVKVDDAYEYVLRWE
jgi:uncharacterized protein (TIGR02265 family)